MIKSVQICEIRGYIPHPKTVGQKNPGIPERSAGVTSIRSVDRCLRRIPYPKGVQTIKKPTKWSKVSYSDLVVTQYSRLLWNNKRLVVFVQGFNGFLTI
jgi:hypothetical protein